MAQFGVFQNLQNFQPRQRDFQTGLTKFFSLLHELALTGMMRAYYDHVAEHFQPETFR